MKKVKGKKELHQIKYNTVKEALNFKMWEVLNQTF